MADDAGGGGPSDPLAAAAESGSLWWFGVVLSIVSSIISNLGVNIEKYALMREDARARLAAARALVRNGARRLPLTPVGEDSGSDNGYSMKPMTRRERRAQAIRDGKPRPYAGLPLWWAGLSLVVFGSLGDFAALGFAAQSLITPVGGVTMVANVFFAHFWLKEALSRIDLAGTAAIIAGVVLIAVYADKSEGTYTLDELIVLYEEPAFIIYAIVVGGGSVALYVAVRQIEKIYAAATVVGATGGLQRAKSRRYARFRSFHQFVYPTLSGVLGAQSVLFAKSTAELIKASFRGANQWTDPATYLIALCMFGAIFSQLHFLAEGLRRFDAVYVIPVFQCWFIVITIVGGAVYFKEFRDFDADQAVMFPLGVLVTLSGIVVLSQRRAPP
eukprot:CAMPEP_0203809258 /NCGR_PEP_ID=MMETSP0115-20131106/2157_1 /ASSEMBLY_ACC=CAM_ASM_000227 /TAXON_ID=33651 /ORGANISM="Bicosoecid sp, Strain ms1" /LENGTH=386 /DNA_ID=CAMNT_0050717975 /DNA_START=78 /DNA_END=1235 /DNA_ORIENTATION=+